MTSLRERFLDLEDEFSWRCSPDLGEPSPHSPRLLFALGARTKDRVGRQLKLRLLAEADARPRPWRTRPQ